MTKKTNSKKIYLLTIRTTLFTNIFLILSSFLYKYVNFYTEIAISTLLLITAILLRKKTKLLSIPLIFAIIFYLSFIYWNTNYIFILLLTIVLAILTTDIINSELNISPYFYSLIVILIALHVVWWNYTPLGYEINYKLDIGTENDINKDKEIYLVSSDNISSRTCVENSCYRVVNKTAIVKFNKEHLVDEYEVKLGYSSQSPIYINNKLVYSPQWNDYKKVGEYKEYKVYISPQLDIQFINSLEEVPEKSEVYANFNINNSLTTYNFKDEYYNNFEKYETVDFNKHYTNTTFRGNVKFLGYFNEKIELDFIKHDMNMYNGSEELNVSIRNSEGFIIHNFIVQDDGYNLSTLNRVKQNISEIIQIPRKGIYSLEFNIVNNKGSDCEIVNLSVNTNKFVSLDYIYIRRPAKIYFENLETIDYRYNHPMYQEVELSNNTIIEIKYSEDLKAKWQTIKTSQITSLNLPEGNLMFKSSQPMYIGYWNNSVIKSDISPDVLFLENEIEKYNAIILDNVEDINIYSPQTFELNEVTIKIER